MKRWRLVAIPTAAMMLALSVATALADTSATSPAPSPKPSITVSVDPNASPVVLQPVGSPPASVPAPRPSVTRKPAVPLTPHPPGAPTFATTTTPTVAAATFPMTASAMTLTGFVYNGVATVHAPGGDEQVLQFSITSGSIKDIDYKLGCARTNPAIETYVAAGATVQAGDMLLDVTDLVATDPTSVARHYTVASPPAGTVDGTWTAVTLAVAYFNSASLTGPMQQRPTTC